MAGRLSRLIRLMNWTIMENQELKNPKDEQGQENCVENRTKGYAWRIVRRTLKTVAWIVGILIVLVALALGLVVWILTPGKLTPIVERFANDMLDAEVKIGKVELTVWHTFPYASIDIEDLNVRSMALDGCRDSLPSYADSLLSLGRLRAEINLAKIPLMQFDVQEILIDSPYVNLFSVNDSVNNFMIFPMTSEETDTTEPVMIVPDIVIRKFAITNNRGLRFTDLSSDMTATLNTDTVTLRYNQDDMFYSLLFCGGVYARMPHMYVDQTVPFYFKGDINWNMRNPYKCTIRDFRAEVAEVPVSVNADFDMTDTLSVQQFDVVAGPVRYADLARQIPAEYLKGLERIRTDFEVSANLKLSKPFKVGKKRRPTFTAALKIPDCYIQPGKWGDYRINDFALDADFVYDGENVKNSTLTLNRFLLDGFGINLAVEGEARNVVRDPSVSTRVEGSVDFGKVLKLIPREIPMRLSGNMSVNTDAKFKMSDLNGSEFHKIQVNGDIDFRNLRYTVPKDSMLVFARNACLRFGTDSKFTNKNNEIKDILMASVKVDTMVAGMPGIWVAVTDASMGAGSLGKAADLLDTTTITPIGAQIKIGRLNMLSKSDSSRVRIRGFQSNGSIRRFGKSGRLPLLEFGIGADLIAYSDRMTHLSLREGDIWLSANMKPFRRNRRVMARLDSLEKIYPGLSRDSLVKIYRKNLAARYADEKLSEEDYIDLSIDNEFKKIFRRWNMRGSLKARRGLLFTPYFPLKNELRDVDMSFNTDRFDIRNITYCGGRSDISMSGAVTNIRSTLMGSRRRPLTIRFTLKSDTLDVNQLIAAAYKGSAFSLDTESTATFNLSNVENESQMQDMVDNTAEEADTAVHNAIVIPKNVAIEFKLRNKYARYADLDLRDLRGDLNMNNGVLNLQNLSGKTVDGSLNLDLLYATANRHDIGVGMFLDLKDINVGRFLKLMPGLDTIMPMLKGVDGIINARLAATTKVDSLMNVVFPTTNAALHIDGKDLVLLDSETFRKVSKMLLFKNKNKNMIDSLSVEAAVYDSKIDVYPFILSIDRYRLGVVGTNDFDMNFNYHISVFKSPIPFLKFGINISGNLDDISFGIGKAKLKENQVARTTLINDSTKVNLFTQMGNIFKQGAEAAIRENSSMFSKKDLERLRRDRIDLSEQQISRSDSLVLIQNGVLTAPDTTAVTPQTNVGSPARDGVQSYESTDAGKKHDESAVVKRDPATKPDGAEDTEENK